jgi:DNA helicase-2/ATP-dependent DNA helicase PcrA
MTDLPDHLLEGYTNAGLRRQETKTRASSWSSSSGKTWADPTQWSTVSPRPTLNPRPPAAPGYAGPSSRNLPRPYADDDLEEPDGRSQPKFRTGQRVRHVKFGEGTVIESKITGQDEEVSVAFPGVGIKRLAASFAGLELLEGKK